MRGFEKMTDVHEAIKEIQERARWMEVDRLIDEYLEEKKMRVKNDISNYQIR